MNTSKNNTKQTENLIANTTTAVQEVDTLQTQSFKELLKNLMSKNKYVLDESVELSKVQEAIKISKIMSILHKETLLYTQMSLMNINNLDVSEFPYSNSIKTISKKTFVSYLKIVSDSNPICNELLCCMFNFMFHNIRDDDFINDFYNNDQVDISVVINNSSIKLSEIIKKVMDVKKLHYSEFETVCYMDLFTYFCQIFSAIKESNKFQKSLTLINYNKPEIGFKDLKYVDLSHHITNKFLIVQLIKSSLSLNNKVYFLKLLGCSRSSYFENNTAIKHLFCDLVCEYNDKVKNQLLTETLNKETSAAKKEILKKSFVNNVKHTECEFIDLVTGDDYLNTLNLTKEEKSLSFFQYDKIERYVKQLVADACVPIFYLI